MNRFLVTEKCTKKNNGTLILKSLMSDAAFIQLIASLFILKFPHWPYKCEDGAVFRCIEDSLRGMSTIPVWGLPLWVISCWIERNWFSVYKISTTGWFMAYISWHGVAQDGKPLFKYWFHCARDDYHRFFELDKHFVAVRTLFKLDRRTH